jgi:hypothetical protein
VAVCGTECPLADTAGGLARQEAGRTEFRVDEGDDLTVNDLDGAVAVNEDDAGRLTGGDLAILVVNPAVELFVLALETAFVAVGRGGGIGRNRRAAGW